MDFLRKSAWIFFKIFMLWSVLSLFGPRLLSRKLENVSPEKYKLAQSLNKHPLFKKGEVRFWVSYDPLRFLVGGAVFTAHFYPKDVFISRFSLNDPDLSPYLDIILAHELGHIQYGFEASEWHADFFAAKICGEKRILNFFNSVNKNMGWPHKIPRHRVAAMEALVLNNSNN